jgi:hypothetical protein
MACQKLAFPYMGKRNNGAGCDGWNGDVWTYACKECRQQNSLQLHNAFRHLLQHDITKFWREKSANVHTYTYLRVYSIISLLRM